MNREATIKGQKITCLGELLIDFVCTDIAQGLVKGENFLKKAGGAPANVAVAIARLGGNARLAAQVGNDPFGEFLIQTLRRESLDTSLIIRDNHAPTTLAFVGVQHDGERDFVFCRGADGNLSQENLPVDFLKDSGIVHLGAATGLLDGQLYQTYTAVAQCAKEEGKMLSFDPNFRRGLWGGHEPEFIRRCEPFLKMADVIKMSEEELELITGHTDKVQGCRYLHDLGATFIAITLGNRGTWASHRDGGQTQVPSIVVKSIDSTGAGDAFVGALLFRFMQRYSQTITHNDFITDVAWANRVGALTCTRFGAIDAIPSWAELV
ncbi:carbohydrate kinase [Yersinia intermedia]|uniref:carbohydrate kinase family protein n=1 Tax=Yersinia intermedia TaxID=631 RepID=UPI001C95E753|nr:carbohydrate kinase [Yersinia intermedia]MCW8111939.1 carbohydrate kinase [Yersinia intermedia]MDA5483306.1 carbohydrate kinase [Yersinia intermedia]MDA5518849.1 carbohydrate kinase [Yersinia intermedia]